MLSPQITSRAFKAKNGEFAFAPDDVVGVVSQLAASGLAVLGGEVWLVSATGEIVSMPR